jgi:hypothetical protein
MLIMPSFNNRSDELEQSSVAVIRSSLHRPDKVRPATLLSSGFRGKSKNRF